MLRESEEKFRNLAEESPNMIFIYGDGRVLYANRQCEMSTGYSRETLYAPGFDLRSLIAPGYDVIAAQSLEGGSGGEEVPPYEIALVTQAGTRIDCHPHHPAHPLRGRPGGARHRHGHHRRASAPSGSCSPSTRPRSPWSRR